MRDVIGDETAAEFLERRNIYATPVLLIGDAVVVGFQKDRIDALLGLGA